MATGNPLFLPNVWLTIGLTRTPPLHLLLPYHLPPRKSLPTWHHNLLIHRKLSRDHPIPLRSNPYTIALSSAIRSGRLGQILSIQGIWATRKGGSFGGIDYYEGWKVDPKSGGTISSECRERNGWFITEASS